MGLLPNGIYGYKVASNATLLGSLPTTKKNFATNVLTWQTANRENTSFPSGLRQSAFYMPLKDGGIRITLTGGSNLTSGIMGVGVLTASVTGSGNITQAELNAGRNLEVTLTGGGDLIVADIEGPAKMRCVIRIGANPSAFDIAQAVWGAVAAQNDTVNSMGEKLNDAGGSGNPWTDTSSYPAGSKGALLQQAADDAEMAAIK